MQYKESVVQVQMCYTSNLVGPKAHNIIYVNMGKLLVAKKLEEYKRKLKKLRNFVLNSFFFFLSINFFRFFYLTWLLFYL